MAFNLKKQAQKAKDSVLPLSKGITDNAEKYSLTQNTDFVPNFNTTLDADRRPIEGDPQVHEGMLEDRRKEAAKSEMTIEGELNKASSPLYPHRQVDDQDSHNVAPINVLSEAFDRKYRDAFAKANNDGNTAFWDKYLGVQLDGERTKVPNNVPESGSQLPNHPSRFTSFKGLPTESSAITNRENLGKEVTVKPMEGYKGNEKAQKMVVASLRDADRLLFHTYLTAAKANRELNAEEKELVAGINRDKAKALIVIAQQSNAPQPPSHDVGDFMDGNPDPTQGDELLWARMSGLDPSTIDQEMQQPVTGADSLPDLSSTLPEPPQENGEQGALDGQPPVAATSEPYFSNTPQPQPQPPEARQPLAKPEGQQGAPSVPSAPPIV